MADTHITTHAGLAHHFDDIEQQREAGTLGMWAFLVTEVMFFGGLFLAYILYRAKYSEAFEAASAHLNWRLGFFQHDRLDLQQLDDGVGGLLLTGRKSQKVDRFSDSH